MGGPSSAQDRSSGASCLCLARSNIFFGDLLRAVTVSLEPAFCSASSYSTSTNKQAAKGVQVSVEGIKAEGRAILIVDDICDTGSTLRTLDRVFLELGAAEVASVVMIHRTVPGSQYQPRWSGFNYRGDEWFVGFGLDDLGWHRNLPGVYCMPANN